jgi:predicted nucleic acid-binding protein
VFCAFFNAAFEPERAAIVRELLKSAEAGEIKIITSSFTLVEVLKVDRKRPLSKAAEDKISAFFEKPYINLVNLDRIVGEAARHLIWKYSHLMPKDSVHLASAIYYSQSEALDALFSFDTDFTKLHGKVTRQFPISKPYINQPSLESWASKHAPDPSEEGTQT